MFGAILGFRFLPHIIAASLAFGAGAWTVHKLDAGKIERLRFDVRTITASRDAFVKAFKEAERLRASETIEARDAVSNAVKDCNARVAQARASARAAAALMARPVKTDAKGCPVPALWTAKDLAPSLGGWK